MSEREKTSHPRSRAASASSPAWVWIAGAFVALCFVALAVAYVLAGLIPDVHAALKEWSSATGAVGDSIGPVFSLVAILVTAWLALYWQPRQQAREELRRQAVKVVAWPARAVRLGMPGDPVRGVVIANASDEAAGRVGIRASKYVARGNRLVAEGEQPAAPAAHHLDFVPPGTYFLPWRMDEKQRMRWRALAPVEQRAGGFEVGLIRNDDRHTDTYVLMPDVSPHEGNLRVDVLRFDLAGHSWVRGEDGVLVGADERCFEQLAQDETFTAAAEEAGVVPEPRSPVEAIKELMKVLAKLIGEERIEGVSYAETTNKHTDGRGLRIFLEPAGSGKYDDTRHRHLYLAGAGADGIVPNAKLAYFEPVSGIELRYDTLKRRNVDDWLSNPSELYSRIAEAIHALNAPGRPGWKAVKRRTEPGLTRSWR